MRFIIPEIFTMLLSSFMLYKLLPMLLFLDKQDSMSLLIIPFIIIPICLFINSLLSSILFIIKPEENLSGIIKEVKVRSSTDEDGDTSYSYFLYLKDDKRKFNINYLKNKENLYINYKQNPLFNTYINIKYKKILNRYIVTDIYYL